jgi:hypothetical protein
MLNNGEMTQEWYDELVKDNAENYAQRQANLAEYGYNDWYDWAISNWGTKWGDYDLVLDRGSDDYLFARYTTAWGPMMEALRYISGLFPDLQFLTTYDEPGMCFCGAAAHYRGEMVAHVTVEHDSYPGYDGDEDEYEDFLEGVHELLAGLADVAGATLEWHVAKESAEISD